VQHDGNGWRCLVACRFAVILDRDFQADPSPQNPPRGAKRKGRFAGSSTRICSACESMGVMNGQQAGNGFPSHSISRITCSNLVEAGDDFDRQYFKVMT